MFKRIETPIIQVIIYNYLIATHEITLHQYIMFEAIVINELEKLGGPYYLFTVINTVIVTAGTFQP